MSSSDPSQPDPFCESVKCSYLQLFFNFSLLKVEKASKALLVQYTYMDLDY